MEEDGKPYYYLQDDLGSVTNLTGRNGESWERFAFDEFGLPVFHGIDGNEAGQGFAGMIQYDAMGHLTKIDRVGNIENTDAEKPEHQVTAYQWNQSGHLERITDPLGAVESYQYDKNGRAVSKTDRDGYTTGYSYDPAGNLDQIFYADGKKVGYSYNALRQLEEIQDWLGITTIRLDALGRPLSVTDPVGKTVGYEWGSMGEKTKLVDPDGNEAIYSYNRALQLVSLQMGKEGKPAAYQYDPMGRLLTKQLPNGMDTAYQYNQIGRLESLTHTGPEGPIQSYRYAYDLAGNKIQKEKERADLPEDSGLYDYQYDALNRLTEVSRNGERLRSYAYDAFGNRTGKQEYTDGVETRTGYGYNKNNQLIKSADAGLEKTYQYDGRGNLSRVMSGTDVLQQYTFDAANFMTGAEDALNPAYGRTEYGYNGLGKRISQQIFQKDSQDMQNPLKKIEYTLDLTREYYNLLGLEDRVAGTKQGFFWDGNVAAMEEDGKPYYYLQDDLGSVTNLTGRNGESRERFAFDEFGLPVFHGINGKETGQGFTGMVQPFAFTGYQPDETTGLYYAQARRYDAGAGRFVSEDRIRGILGIPNTLNFYPYCWNNPCIYCDLNGMFLNLIVGAVVGAAFNVGARIVTDVISGHRSSWQEYVGDMIGGAIGGAIFAGTGNAAAAGAANGAASTLITSGLNFLSGEKVSVKDTLEDAVINAGVGAGLGYVGGKASLKVEGVNTGRGSYKQITKMLSTQMKNGTMLKSKSGLLGVSWKNWSKAFQWQITDQDAGISIANGFFNDSGLPGSEVKNLLEKLVSNGEDWFDCVQSAFEYESQSEQ